MAALLEVRDLTVQYGGGTSAREAVAGVSFDMAAGEVVGLMGESGCGKTSIALALLGLLPERSCAVSGSVMFRGQELLNAREPTMQRLRGAEISLVSQDPRTALSPVMRVGEQIAEVIHAHRDFGWKRCREAAAAMIARVGLPQTERVYSAYPHQLSGGQLQRVVLAQALACGPAIIIADEPTASLDACSQRELLNLLRDLKRQTEVALLLISHTPEVQARLADRLLVMAEGRVIERGSFAQLYQTPYHAYTRAMLRATLSPAADRDLEHTEAALEQVAGSTHPREDDAFSYSESRHQDRQ